MKILIKFLQALIKIFYAPTNIKTDTTTKETTKMVLTTVEISKKSVTENMGGQWSIRWGLKGFDESLVELFSAIFSEDYKKGDNISRIEAGFIEQMQAYIDKYKKEQQLLNASQHNTAVTNVQTALEV